MDISNRGQEFLVYAALGIVPERIFDKYKESYADNYQVQDYDHYRILLCAKRAYLDLNRTLVRQDKESDNSSFSNTISGQIADIIYMNRKKKIAERKVAAFKYYNNESLRMIVKGCLQETQNSRKEESGEDEVQRCFHYGQFQKWINMTFKYMDVIGMIKEDDEKILDIPLDSYIMRAMSQKGIEFPRNVGGKGNYTDASVKWSRLTKEEYDEIVKDYRKPDCDISKSPIEWEHEEWIVMAEKEKKVISK